MKLLFFINTLAGGGAEKVLVDLVNQLPPDKFDISVISLLNGIHESHLASHIHHECIIRTRNHLLSFILERFYCKVIPYKCFSYIYFRGDYDAVISYLEGFSTHVVAAYKGTAKRIAFVHCNTGSDSGWTKSYRSLEKCYEQYLSFNRVCFISQDSLAGFERVVGHLPQACVVHNVIDLKQVLSMSKAASPKISYSGTCFYTRLISVGRLTRVKGFERLIKVVARLRDEQIYCDLTICGDGDLRQGLERLVKELALSNVHFMGFQSNPYQFIAKSDFYVCSSYSEGYSTSVVEAIALGIPVLTTDCSGMREILCNGEYGDIVENSEDGLYYGLKRILTDSNHCLNLRNKVSVRSQELLLMNPISEYLSLFENL